MRARATASAAAAERAREAARKEAELEAERADMSALQAALAETEAKARYTILVINYCFTSLLVVFSLLFNDDQLFTLHGCMNETLLGS